VAHWTNWKSKYRHKISKVITPPLKSLHREKVSVQRLIFWPKNSVSTTNKDLQQFFKGRASYYIYKRNNSTKKSLKKSPKVISKKCFNHTYLIQITSPKISYSNSLLKLVIKNPNQIFHKNILAKHSILTSHSYLTILTY
jgi:hypothetical protein